MNQLSSTLSRCAKDVAGFTLMFFIVFLAFVQLAYLVFGTQIRDFSTIPNCIFTQLRIILGDFDFQAIEKAHGVIGPLYFFTYIFFVFFVLMNMFLAIINDTYAEVKGDRSQDDQFQVTDYFKQTYGRIIHKLGKKREKIVDIQAAVNVADEDGDRKVDFAEWRRELRKRGYEEEEITAVFGKYDKDKDNILSAEEKRNMLEDLQDKKEDIDNQQQQLEQQQYHQVKLQQQISKETRGEENATLESDSESDDGSISVRKSADGVSKDEFQVLNRRVDKMEGSIGSILSKIDGVLEKLVSMEKVKTKRRETMNKLLQTISGTEIQREDMEKLVNEELRRWESDSSITKEISGTNREPSKSDSASNDESANSRPGSNDESANSRPGSNGDNSLDSSTDEKPGSPRQITVDSSATNC